MKGVRIVLSLVGGFAFMGTVSSANAQSACPTGAPQGIVYHPGSLTAAFAKVEALFSQQTGIGVVDASAGSVDAARRVTAGQEPCDIYASADDKLTSSISFAQGAMVLAYTVPSKNASSIVAPNVSPPAQIPPVASNWVAQLTQSGVLIGGSNPFLDPERLARGPDVPARRASMRSAEPVRQAGWALHAHPDQ